MGFDKKMDAYITNARTKQRKQLRRAENLEARVGKTARESPKKRARDEEYEQGPGSSSEDGGDAGGAVRARKWQTGAQISFVDGNGDPFAHGQVLDDEPCTAALQRSFGVDDDVDEFPVGLWKLVTIKVVVRGWNTFELEADMVYSETSDKIAQKQRKISELAQLRAFIVWHEYVAPRVRAVKSSGSHKKKKT